MSNLKLHASNTEVILMRHVILPNKQRSLRRSAWPAEFYFRGSYVMAFVMVLDYISQVRRL